MQTENSAIVNLASRELMDTMIRFGVIVVVLFLCFRVFTPFMSLMVWALVLAVALYPLHQRLAGYLGGRQGRAATLLVVGGLLLIGGPTVMLGSSFAKQIHNLHVGFENKTLSIDQPDPRVADWPLVGERIYKAWTAAATNLPAYVEANKATLENLAGRALSAAAGTATGVLLFLGALIIAGVMMAYGDSSRGALERILSRLAGAVRGPEIFQLSTMTIRSVAAGVIGVAFIQALLLGVGFIFAGVPAAGLLALVVMLIGIVQIPALIVSLPVIAYLWMGGEASTTSNIVWSVYLVLAGMSDNVLKPLLLGRGVDAPMPIILIGALGGMVAAGIIGLFIGAVLLAVGYRVFMDWVGEGELGEVVEAEQVESA